MTPVPGLRDAILEAMMNEPGLRSTVDIAMSLTQEVAAPGDRLTLTTELRSGARVARGKVIGVEERRAGEWRSVGVVIVALESSRWVPGENPRVRVTAEGYLLSVPMHFDVPLLAPGQYRLRLDVVAIEDAELRDRTATLYAPLRVV